MVDGINITKILFISYLNNMIFEIFRLKRSDQTLYSIFKPDNKYPWKAPD